MKLPSLAEVRKSVVAVLGVAGILVSTGLLHGSVEAAVNAVLAAATAAGVYGVPNVKPAAPAPVVPPVAPPVA